MFPATASLLFCFSFGLLYLRILHSLAVTALCCTAASASTVATVAIAAAAGATAAAAAAAAAAGGGGGGGGGAVAVAVAAAAAAGDARVACRCATKYGVLLSALFIIAVQCSKFFGAAMRCTAWLSADGWLSRAVAARAEPVDHFLVHVWQIGGRGQGSAAML